MHDRDRNQIFMGINRIKDVFAGHVAKPEKQGHNATNNGHNAKTGDC